MFATIKAPPDRERPKQNSNLSYIGVEAVVSGGLSTPAQFHIDGRVDGDVRCRLLIQGHSGTITGDIVAEEARLGGLVEGTVSAVTVMLDATARITGDISCENLAVAAGAQVEGRFICRPGVAAGVSKKESRRAPARPRPQAGKIVPPPEAGLFGSGEPVPIAAE